MSNTKPKMFDVIFKTKNKKIPSKFKGTLTSAKSFFTKLSSIDPVIISVYMEGIRISPQSYIKQIFKDSPDEFVINKVEG